MTELRPPAEVQWLVDLVGAERTLEIIERHGGRRICIPQTYDPKSAFAQEFGEAAAKKLVAELGGTDGRWKRVPLLKWWRARVYRARDMTYPQIAAALGCTEQTAWRYLHPSGEPSRLQLQFELE